MQGPSDPGIHRSLIDSHQPVSRVGEVVVNCFVDGDEFGSLPKQVTSGQVCPKNATNLLDRRSQEELNSVFEQRPLFHQWASVTPGMILVTRKARSAPVRKFVAIETATPTLASCACLVPGDESNFQFSGITRTKSIREISDGVGPIVDEYFTSTQGVP